MHRLHNVIWNWAWNSYKYVFQTQGVLKEVKGEVKGEI